MKLFILPTVISVVALLTLFIWGGIGVLFLATILIVLEVTLQIEFVVSSIEVFHQMKL